MICLFGNTGLMNKHSIYKHLPHEIYNLLVTNVREKAVVILFNQLKDQQTAMGKIQPPTSNN